MFFVINLLNFYRSISMLSCRGYNIGVRLIDEFLAKSNVSRCADFKETADVIAKVISLFSQIGYGHINIWCDF